MRWRLTSPTSRLFAEPFVEAQIKQSAKLRVTGICDGNPPVTGGSPSQRASNAANGTRPIFIPYSWSHHITEARTPHIRTEAKQVLVKKYFPEILGQMNYNKPSRIITIFKRHPNQLSSTTNALSSHLLSICLHSKGIWRAVMRRHTKFRFLLFNTPKVKREIRIRYFGNYLHHKTICVSPDLSLVGTFRWFIARLQYLQCVSNGDTAV